MRLHRRQYSLIILSMSAVFIVVVGCTVMMVIADNLLHVRAAYQAEQAVQALPQHSSAWGYAYPE